MGADVHIYARTLIPVNTRTQPYPYEYLWETEPTDPRNHHRHLVINGHVVYHWKSSTDWGLMLRCQAPMPSIGFEHTDFTIRNLSNWRAVRKVISLGPICRLRCDVPHQRSYTDNATNKRKWKLRRIKLNGTATKTKVCHNNTLFVSMVISVILAV